MQDNSSAKKTILENNRGLWEKYHRRIPIKNFDVEQTMYSLVSEESKGYEDYPAIGFFGNDISFGELLKSVDIMAQAFHNLGIRSGDNVAILTVSTPIVQECLLALSKIGAVQIWIDLRCKEKDLIKYLNDSKCKCVVVFDEILPMIEHVIDKTSISNVIVSSPKDYLPPVLKIGALLKDLKEGKKTTIPDDQRYITYAKFMRTGKLGEHVVPSKFDPDKESIVVQSSGSTGKPKLIAHTEYGFNVFLKNAAYLDFPYYRGTIMHNPVPPFIIYGLSNTIYVSLGFTMKCELHPQVEDSSVYDDLGKFEISLAAPVHYRYINKKINDLKEEIKQLEQTGNNKQLRNKQRELARIKSGIEKTKLFVSGGDKLGVDEHLEMQQVFDKVIASGYGNNECMGAAIVPPIFANKPGTVGVPMHNVDVKIINTDSGEDVRNGEVGEVYIASECLFKEYINNPEETKQNRIVDLNQKAWVKTGDLGYIDDDGFVVITGRSRRLIKKDAFKISPDYIENVILDLPFVGECVVVGVDDEINLSVPMAFIKLNDNSLSKDEAKRQINQKCMEELPNYEVPSYYEIVDSLPYTQNNKYNFKALEKLGNEIVSSNSVNS